MFSIGLLGVSIFNSSLSFMVLRCGRNSARSDGDNAASNCFLIRCHLMAWLFALSLEGQEHRSVS
jgi:hypothetical protein